MQGMRGQKHNELITDVFKREVKPALGCTELATIGIVSSLALNAALDNLTNELGIARKIEAKDIASINRLFLTLDPYLFKNAADVGISGTEGECGIKLAATLCLFRNPKGRLQIFDSVSKEHLNMAKKLKKPIQFRIRAEGKMPDIYAEAEVKIRKRWGRARIQHEHDKVVLVESDKGVLFKEQISKREGAEEQRGRFKNLTIDDLIDYVTDLPSGTIAIVKNATELVEKLSNESLRRPLGMGIGYALREIGDDMRTLIKARTASAIDARMFGSSNPSISVAGSGNQGITATMPICAYAKKTKLMKTC